MPQRGDGSKGGNDQKGVARTYQAEKPSECGGDRLLNFARRLGAALFGQNARRLTPRRSQFGGASRARTDDLVVANDALSQLSYSPTETGDTLLSLSGVSGF
jgi:hypothetical protein